MLEFDTKVKKWGNSLGVILPKFELEKREIGENETLHIIVMKKNRNIRKTFGMLKGWKTGQQIKDLSRKELYD